MSELKYKVGDKVRIKSIDWYNENNVNGDDILENIGIFPFFPYMARFCGQVLTIKDIHITYYTMEETDYYTCWTDEMIEGLVEEETKPKFKVGDRVIVSDTSGIWEITDMKDNTLYSLKRENHTATLTTYGGFLTLHEGTSDETIESKVEDELLDEYEELTDRAFKGGYEKCKSDIELNGFQLPEGYMFKDENGNEIRTSKIILEKANTLKIQNDNMETDTHKGYYTTEEETTNESKKATWFTFWDNDFADKVELDLSNRELIQEDGKWFVVKKKKEYPKTYKACCDILKQPWDKIFVLETIPENHTGLTDSEIDLFKVFIKLKRCRDAYWTLYGEEKGLGKPWEPDWKNDEQGRYMIMVYENKLHKDRSIVGTNFILVFPTPEMRDAFYDNFKEEIEQCKELL
jgi:hypothetical protein